jgi:hypothetical protein
LGFATHLNVATHLLWQMPQQPSYEFELMGVMKVGYCKFQVLVCLQNFQLLHLLESLGLVEWLGLVQLLLVVPIVSNPNEHDKSSLIN